MATRYHVTYRTSGLVRAASGVALATLLIACACRLTPGGSRRSADREATDGQTDRLRATYAPLRDGHFAVIADFESPIHETIFNLINASGTATTRVDRSAGRNVTGATALRVRLGGASDAVLASGESSSEWTLKRDWRDFDVLLMAIHADAARALRLELTAGRDETKRRYETSLDVRPGWNLVSLDLWDAGRSVPRDDVRELRLSCPNGPYPADLVLDDLILSRDRQWLLGERGRNGEVFVERQADRLNCGVGGLFEWSFLRGRIVGWYDLANDPNRLSNLADGQAAGPSPGRLTQTPGADRSSAESSAEGRSPLDGAESLEQTIVEANRIRVVVHCGAPAAPSGGNTGAQRGAMECTYFLYASGRAFVQAKIAGGSATGALGADADPASASTTHAAANVADIAWRWSWGRPAGWTQEAVDLPSDIEGASVQARLVVLTGPSVGSAPPRALLAGMVDHGATACPCPTGGSADATFVSNATQRDAGDATRVFDAVVLFGSDLTQLVQQARDVVSSSGITLTQGRFRGQGGQNTSLPAALQQPGGCYELRDDAGAVRLMIDGRRLTRWAPMVKILDPQRRPCWIYVDHHLWNNQFERLDDGSLLVRLPEVKGRETAVECLFSDTSP